MIEIWFNNTSLELNTYYHIGILFNNGYTQTYINGKLQPYFSNDWRKK